MAPVLDPTDMNRREFVNRSTVATLGIGLRNRSLIDSILSDVSSDSGRTVASSPQSVLPGTEPLTMLGDIAAQMVEGIHRYLLQKTERQVIERAPLWNRDYSSVEAYERSVAPNVESFRRIIGAVDERVEAQAPKLSGTATSPAPLAAGSGYEVYEISWRVFAPVTADSNGMEAEGLLLQPEGEPVARVVAIPDADWTPEMLAGLVLGVSPSAQFARRLAQNSCEVIIPLIINREDTFSGIPDIAMTNIPHREWIYRMSYEVGRHIIGFEVQKVLAAVDWFEKENIKRRLPIGVMGYGEGGLLALYSAAIDNRIAATAVSGYFQAHDIWKEPIYRDVWALSREFGDSDLASLVAPRSLVVEACKAPEVSGPPQPTDGRQDYACPNGKLITPPLQAVKEEVDRARPFFEKLYAARKLQFVVSEEGGTGEPGSDEALDALLKSLGVSRRLRPSGKPPVGGNKNYDPIPRLHRQFDQIVNFAQALIRKSPERRKEFWSKADKSSQQRWHETTKLHRDYIWDEVIGRLPSPNLPVNPRTRQILDDPKFTGYEVVLDVWQDVFAYGTLLVPKDLKPRERRPVVVCQHGLEGRPTDVVDPRIDNHFYHHFGATLAEQGFVIYAPQNPYIGHDDFRIIQRMGHPLKLALFSFIIGQHEQTLNWLATQPFVDPERIGFYGLSYGGKTAVRVPPFLDRYALSICAGDFNEWVWKTSTVLAPQSYLLTVEYDMYEFNFANIVNYSDLANLMVPRPFMVERGHEDPVSIDEEVAYEYAAVRRFYDEMGLGDDTKIEFFNGPHEIHGVGTFDFLHRHLRWPG
jgi:dienelactone hydrolase